MTLNDKTTNFDINRNNIFNLTAKQYDTDGARSFTFRLLKNSVPFSLEGLSVKVGGKKPDEKNVFNDCIIKDAKKGIVEVELTTQMQVVAGTLNLELIILRGETRLSTIPFEVQVIKSATDFKEVESSNEFGALNTALNIANEYADKLKEGTEKIELQYADKLNKITTPFTSTNKVKMIAHRGLSSEAPENTLPAYELAAKNGYWGAETDIFETSDGHFVLMHDETVDRMTNGTGKISDMTLAQIKELNIDTGSNIENYPNLKVPTLSEYLLTCKKYGIVPVIEIKTIPQESCEKFIEEIRQWGLETDCVVISFNKTVMENLRKLSKDINLHPLLTLTPPNMDFCANLGKNTCIDVPHSQVTKMLVNMAHSKGVLVNCWTVDNKVDMDKIIDNGVDFITTNKLKNENDITTNIGNTYKVDGATLSDLAFSNFPIEERGYIDKFKGEIIGINNYKYIDNRYNDKSVKVRFIHKELFKIDNPMLYLEFNPDFKISIHMFDENKMFINNTIWNSKGGYKIIPSGVKYIIIYCRKANESEITNDDLKVFSKSFKCINGLKEETFSINNLLIEGLLENTTTHRRGRAFSLDAIRVKGRFNIEIINYPTDLSSECLVTARPFDINGADFQDIGWIPVETKKGILDNKTDTILPYIGKRIETEFTEEEINKIKNIKVKLSL